MSHAATMDDELFRALRDDAGMPEAAAAKVAKLIFRRGEDAARAGREAERENFATKVDVANLRAEIPDREAERAADRDAFAAKDDVTVLQTKSENTDSAIDRIDKTLVRIDERFVRIDERFERIDERFRQIDERFNGVDKSLARLDERMNGLQWQNKVFIIPLLFVVLAALFGIGGLLIRLLIVLGQ